MGRSDGEGPMWICSLERFDVDLLVDIRYCAFEKKNWFFRYESLGTGDEDDGRRRLHGGVVCVSVTTYSGAE